ncbi:ABC transporter substrate-binding protein [Subtercola frigoramans]|uniref:Peptide/nickel transport system substrate-binding protein n=1 Tax=Subtercola frigoramans TaxID=120298 RepID=A0ABS2L0Z9_9MICO|nr:ABC transporter substrate-binding protein [Subtercola frigoramans]MBM7470760.1 peptide/nickel transport system substrate-binding protein [Subtercola frigoramans]
MFKKSAIAGAAIIALALVVTGCTGSGNSPSKESKTLTVGLATGPVSLDPSKGAAGFGEFFTDPAYASLINTSEKGDLIPGLAEKWGYVGDDNKTFTLTLRSGLKFADGTDLNAQSVVNSVAYFVTGSGPTTAYFRNLKLTATDNLTVNVVSSEPNPLMPFLFSNTVLGGDIISAAGIDDPTGLASTTHGAGPYVYDAAQSVAEDHYVYTPNKNFWDQTAIHFDKIEIKVIPQIQSLVQALKSGQIDTMVGDPSVESSIKGNASIAIEAAPIVWNGVYLLDRNGVVAPALADLRVRQALNYAVDRSAIAKVAYGDSAVATDQAAVTGFDGYDPALEGTYPYDPEKAKQLLQEAGYGNGFSMAVNYQSFDPGSTKMIQAVAAQWAKIGVTLELKGNTNFGEWVGDLVSKKFPASVLNGTGGQPQYLDAEFAWLPTAIMNVFQVADPGVAEAFNTLATASPDNSGKAAQAFQKVIVDNAIAVPIVQYDATLYHGTNLKGVVFPPGFAAPSSIVTWTK